jgi:hypothetical protein
VTARPGVDVLQRLLEAEHAVVYGYGVAGAHLDGAVREQALRGWTAHRGRRDELVALVTERGGTPEPPAAAYDLPAPVRTARDARTLLTLLEERAAAVWADAVAGATGELRTFAVEGLTASAVEAARWRGGSVPFPGLPERAGAARS